MVGSNLARTAVKLPSSTSLTLSLAAAVKRVDELSLLEHADHARTAAARTSPRRFTISPPGREQYDERL